MNVRFLNLAEQELADAVIWYDQQASGLGRDFLDELDRAIRRVAAFPLSFPEIEPELRRCLLTRFPYGVIYGLEQDTILVVAVAHLHRQPRYWADRFDS
jgi:plasmid stabilization system protein ParE